MKFAWINEPPFNFAEDGRVTGSDVELARQAFDRMGVSFEPIETVFGELLPGLKDGRWDVTTGMFITKQRAEQAFFTRPIWSLRDGLLVRIENAAAIRGYRAVAQSGGTLAVLQGQVQMQTALELGVPAERIEAFGDYQEAALAVSERRVIAYASVEPAHKAHLDRFPGSGLACVEIDLEEKRADDGGFACSARDIRDRLDEALCRLEG